MTLSPDISGLRRRSPNPNSPHLDPNEGAHPIQPYSPSLLSPYARAEGITSRLPSRYAQSRRSTSSLSAYTPYGGTTPSIRLVPSHSESENAPTPIIIGARSKSNDIDERTRGEPSSPALKRHETEPTYARLQRSTTGDEPYVISRSPTDRPLPPLPHHVRRNSMGARSMVSSVLTTPSEAGRSDISAGVTSIDAASAGTGRRTWKSLLINPFRDSPSRRSAHDSLRSFGPVKMGSRAMSRWSRSVDSQDTLIETPYTLGKMAKTASEDTLVEETMKRIRSTEGGDKVLQKIPERLVERGKEGWTSFKVVLLLSVLSLFGYGLAGLCWTMQIMLRISPNSDVTMVTDPDVVIFLLLFSLLALFTSFVGLTGTLLSSRPILAFYCLLLWPTLISLALVGYSSYKRANVQLDRKLNQVWSQFLSEEDRLRIQNGLGCCGYYNPFHDATYSKRCYPRTPLAGCKGKWAGFEDRALRGFARAAFSTVPIHLVNIVIALICSNHVDNQFGKGLTPLRYRLQAADVRSNALAVLASLPLEPKPSQASSVPLKRRLALRSSRTSVRSSASTVRLVDPYHQPKARQYSVDSILEDYDKSPPIPFESRQKGHDAGMHRRATEDFGLPTPPTSRWSSLNYGNSTYDKIRRGEDRVVRESIGSHAIRDLVV